MHYSVVMVKNSSDILSEAALKSIRLHMNPDEIIVVNNWFIYSKTAVHHGEGLNKGIAAAKNNIVLCIDHDVIFVNNEIEKQMLNVINNPDVFACGVYDYPDSKGNKFLLPGCFMLKKDLYYANNELFNNSGNPSWTMCNVAREKGQRLIKLDLEHCIFHLGSACRLVQYIHLTKKLEVEFQKWKTQNKLNVKLEDYIFDFGMSAFDHDWLTHTIIKEIETAMNSKLPFSLIRLGDLSLRFLRGFIEKNSDFAHVSMNHPDIATPNIKVANEIASELVSILKDADYIDHPELYRGVFYDLYNWRRTLLWANEVYQKIGINFEHKKFCCSVQNYTIFSQDFELTFYDLVRGRKILYIGKFPYLDELNQRKSLETEKLSYLPGPWGTPEERYNRTNTILNEINVDDWDLIFITASIWGRIIAGRIKKLGGRVFDLGQAIEFNPNNIFDKIATPNSEKTYYKLIDSSHKLAGKPKSELSYPKIRFI